MGYSWSEYYTPKYYREMAAERERERSQQLAAEKRARKAREAEKERKRKIKEEQAREHDEYQKRTQAQYGSKLGGSYGGEDLYNQFNQENSEAYKEEIARRFGTLYDGKTKGEEAQLGNRGLGWAPHQRVKRSQQAAHDPANPLHKRMKVPLGKEQFNPNTKSSGAGQTRRGTGASLGSGANQGQRARLGSSAQAGAKSGGGSQQQTQAQQAFVSAKLNRPY